MKLSPLVFKPSTLVLPILAIIGQPSISTASDKPLAELFSQPENHYAPHAWWHWRNGNINQKEAINDLRWLHNIGIGGVQVFEAGLGEAAPKDKAIAFGTKPWRKAMRASAKNSVGFAYGLWHNHFAWVECHRRPLG